MSEHANSDNDSRHNKREIAYRYLYLQITTNNLKPGEVISEQEISRQTGVSRTPLREALKKLESEGLISHKKNHSAVVTSITEKDVEEIFAIRISLETLALRIGINKIDPAEVDDLIERLEGIDETQPVHVYNESDRLLHDLIIRSSENVRLQRILVNLNAQMERLRAIGSMKVDRLIVSKNEHLSIIRAIKVRNFEIAHCLLTTHLYNVKENALDQCRRLSML